MAIFYMATPIIAESSPINLVIENLNQLAPPLAKSVNAPVLIAQMKTLRAFYYYLGMDLFGDIPITESLYTPLSPTKPKGRTEVFAFVEKKLISIKSQLPRCPPILPMEDQPGGWQRRFSPNCI